METDEGWGGGGMLMPMVHVKAEKKKAWIVGMGRRQGVLIESCFQFLKLVI